MRRQLITYKLLQPVQTNPTTSFIADAYYNEIGKIKFDEWRSKGFLEDNGYNFNIFIDALRYNVYASALKINTPCLITQGDNDEIIPPQHTKYLYECLKTKDKHLEMFESVGHGYSEGDAWDRMSNMFVEWFKKKL